MTAVARSSAYEILLDISTRGKYSNVAILQHYRKHPLPQRDKALCTEIVYGTLQYQRSIDALLEPLVSRGLASIDERVLVILRMAVYQLGYLSRVPGYAVLSDAVDLCKLHARKAAGFVNGVLRSFTRDKRSVPEKLLSLTNGLSDFAVRTGITLSYPDWFVRELARQYGEERTVSILQAGNEPASLSVRVNTTKVSRDEFLRASAEDVGMELSAVSPVGLRLHKGIDVENWSAYKEGLVTVQDEASMLVAPLLDVSAETTVLDLCAGLGTKTTQILEMQGASGHVTSVDIHQHKLVMLKASAERLGLSGLKTVVADARSFRTSPRHKDAYDAVLLDAPCSGMGVLRRRPEIRWRRTQQESKELSELQVELLRSALAAVRPGGVVVYATCTILDAENQEVVRTVLESGEGALVAEDISPYLPDAVKARCQTASGLPSDDLRGGLTLTPEVFGTDGFYMAKIRKLT